MGRPARTVDEVRRFQEQGFLFFMTVTDIDFMAAGATEFLKPFGKARRLSPGGAI
jgi:hypothetical protein